MFFFWKEKDPKWPQESQNVQNFLTLRFYAIFVKVSIDIEALNVEYVQNRQDLFPKKLFQRNISSFSNEKVPQAEIEIERNSKKLSKMQGNAIVVNYLIHLSA